MTEYNAISYQEQMNILESVKDAFGADLTRDEFFNNVLMFVEDMPGMETADEDELMESISNMYINYAR